MYPKQPALAVSLATALVLIAPWVSAGEEHQHDQDTEYRQHGAHVHGIATLDLALEDNELQIEIHSPAINIVGFEHVPSSADERAALDQAVAALKDGDRLFKFSDNADCRMEQANVTTELLDAEPDEHQVHTQQKTEEHAHEHAEEHQHEEHEGDVHSDIMVVYRFQCAAPDQLTALSVDLFEAFSGMEKIKVQYVIESTQGVAELTAADQTIRF
ncbi:MAG: hypothetical protein N838_08225 [Thiohalocapsa sp. PB-PSB1]|nr:MAG: hypothetical protein N838_08225 [Thiohalocapsa sp. PB-PSB1]